MGTLKRWFLSGMLVILPLVVTVWVLDLVVHFLDGSINLLPADWRPENVWGRNIPGVGVVLTIAIILTVGAFASNYLGSKLVKWWDRFLGQIPVVRSIYNAVKQISDTLFASKGDAFREVVLMQYPRRGAWTMALVTGKPGGVLAEHLDPHEYINVYVPTTPNPTSGFYLMVKRAETIALNVSVDEAIKSIISMGVVTPGAHVVPVSDGAADVAVTQASVTVSSSEPVSPDGKQES